MSERRTAKISEEIKRELSSMIMNELKDPRVKGLVSITHVDVTNDLRFAKVYVSVFADEESRNSALKGLSKASGYLRSELAKRLRLRYTPELIFKIDNSIEYGSKINKMLSEIGNDVGDKDKDV